MEEDLFRALCHVEHLEQLEAVQKERRKSMHARVLTAAFQPGKRDSLLRRHQEHVLPAARQHEGFKQVLLLTDPHTHKAMHLSFWETQGHLKGSETSGYLPEQLAGAMPFLAAPPTQEVYEVEIEQMPQPGQARACHERSHTTRPVGRGRSSRARGVSAGISEAEGLPGSAVSRRHQYQQVPFYQLLGVGS